MGPFVTFVVNRRNWLGDSELRIVTAGFQSQGARRDPGVQSINLCCLVTWQGNFEAGQSMWQLLKLASDSRRAVAERDRKALYLIVDSPVLKKIE